MTALDESSIGAKTGVSEYMYDQEHGHHSVRRMVTPIHQVIKLLNRLKLINEDQRKILMGMYGSLSIIMAGYLMYWAAISMYHTIRQYQLAAAAGETAAHAFVQDWGSIILATSVTAMIGGSYLAGKTLAEQENSSRNVPIGYFTPEHRRRVTREVQAVRGFG
jgi:predicted metal-binding membrane protein